MAVIPLECSDGCESIGCDSSSRVRKEVARSLNDIGDDAAANGCASIAAFVKIIRSGLRRALSHSKAHMNDRSLISVAHGVGREC